MARTLQEFAIRAMVHAKGNPEAATTELAGAITHHIDKAHNSIEDSILYHSAGDPESAMAHLFTAAEHGRSASQLINGAFVPKDDRSQENALDAKELNDHVYNYSYENLSSGKK
jgi:hypothetical protein